MQSDWEPSSRGLTTILTLVGAAVVAVFQGAIGLLYGAVLGFLFAQVLHLRSWVSTLHAQVQYLRKEAQQRAMAPEQAKSATPETPAPTATPARATQAPSAEQPSPQPSVSVERPATAAAQERPSAPRSEPSRVPVYTRVHTPVEPSAFERATEAAIAWIKGGNPLARAGITILFFGAAFLAKYAADHSLFPIELRFIAIALGALALLVVGWRLREKRAGYAQLLQGGGIAGLYLTVFAALKLYQLLPPGFAFVLLVVIVLASALLALAQNALPLAVVGTAGGFLAPILVSTGSGNHIALFTYYAVLNLGVFAIAWFRTWRVLNVLGFVLTFGITTLWRVGSYEAADRVSADAFLILFFLMYLAVSILNCLRQPPNLKGYVSGALVFGLPIVAFSLHASIVVGVEYALAWSALIAGALYLALAWTLWRTGRETFRLLVEAFAALGVIFASLAIPLAFDAKVTAAMWSVEGAGLVWLGLRQERKLARAFGILLQVFAGIGFIGAFPALRPDRFLLNTAYLGTVMLGVSALASSFWLHRDRKKLAEYETAFPLVLALWGTAWWLCGGIYQIEHFWSAALLGGALVFVAATAAGLGWIGHRRDWADGLGIAWWLPAVTAFLGLMYIASLTHPFAQYGAIGWVALFAVQYGFLYTADRLERNAPGISLLHVGACLVALLLIAMEGDWQLSITVGGVWPALAWGLPPAFALALFSARKPRPAWPVARHLNTYRFTIGVVLAIATAIWIVGANLTQRGDPVWLPYIPLFNPMDIGVALCIVSLVSWWIATRSERSKELPYIDATNAYVVLAGLVFLWLNAALVRALHYLLGTPLTFSGMASSTLVQAALSVFWGILGFAAMTLAARWKIRAVWIAGAALMAVVVLKLFLVDLSSIGTVARITSFLSVGVLLLVTGYLAPLPPKSAEEELELQRNES